MLFTLAKDVMSSFIMPLMYFFVPSYSVATLSSCVFIFASAWFLAFISLGARNFNIGSTSLYRFVLIHLMCAYTCSVISSCLFALFILLLTERKCNIVKG